MTEQIFSFFPFLSTVQREQLVALQPLYEEWNAKINVISRQDIGNLYPHHVLHSLAIAKAIRFREGTRVMDVGTGGGFPGIPLAILFPEVRFLLVDSVGKKIRVAMAVAEALGLTNVTTLQSRVDDVKEKAHFVVSRATMGLRELIRLSRPRIEHEQKNALPPGVLVLKGGDLTQELSGVKRDAMVWELTDMFPGVPWFEEKKLVFVAL